MDVLLCHDTPLLPDTRLADKLSTAGHQLYDGSVRPVLQAEPLTF